MPNEYILCCIWKTLFLITVKFKMVMRGGFKRQNTLNQQHDEINNSCWRTYFLRDICNGFMVNFSLNFYNLYNWMFYDIFFNIWVWKNIFLENKKWIIRLEKIIWVSYEFNKNLVHFNMWTDESLNLIKICLGD